MRDAHGHLQLASDGIPVELLVGGVRALRLSGVQLLRRMSKVLLGTEFGME